MRNMLVPFHLLFPLSGMLHLQTCEHFTRISVQMPLKMVFLDLHKDSNIHPPFWSFSSVQFSHSVMSNSVTPWIAGSTRTPCPSPTPEVYSNSYPSSQWCHPAIASSVVPFSFCPQSLPASGSFPMSQLFTLGGQSIGVSASASVLPMKTQDWSPLGWTSCSPRDSQESSPTPQFRSINFSVLSFLHSPPLISIHHCQTLTSWPLGKP